MTDIEKRILLNQREIMHALMMMNLDHPILANGLGRACVKTNTLLFEDKEKED